MAKAKYTKNYRNEWSTKVWDGTYNENGTKHRKTLTSKKSSADLEKQVIALKEDVKNGLNTIYTSDDFVSYANRWLESKKNARELNTRNMYHRIIDVHLAFMSGVPLPAVSNSHFQQAINNAIDKPRTCQQIYITFKQIMRCALTDSLITDKAYSNIISDISLPKYIKSEKRPLNSVEKEAIKKATFNDRQKAYVYIIYSCGIRRGEALALTKFDFDFKKGSESVSINKTLVFDDNRTVLKMIPKSSNGIRKVPIPKQYVKDLKKYVSSLPGTYLFTCDNGAMVTRSSYRRLWEGIVNKMNTAAGGTKAFPVIDDLTAHIFRHNYCTNLCYKVPAISIKKIAQLMGDTEKMVLEVYNHIMDEKEDVDTVLKDALAL